MPAAPKKAGPPFEPPNVEGDRNHEQGRCETPSDLLAPQRLGDQVPHCPIDDCEGKHTEPAG
jgi:hypothetical protein